MKTAASIKSVIGKILSSAVTNLRASGPRTLRSKILTVLAMASISGILIYGAVSYLFLVKDITDHARDMMEATNLRIRSDLEDRISEKSAQADYGQVPLSELAAFFSGIKPGFSGFVTLIDRDGVILSHPDKDRISTKLEGFSPDFLAPVSGGAEPADSFHRVRLDEIEYLVSYLPVEKPGWFLVSLLPFDELISVPKRIWFFQYLLLIVIVTIMYILSFLLFNSFTRPLKAIISSVNRISQGDLTQRIAFQEDSDIGILVTTLNQMTENLEVSRMKEAERSRELMISNRILQAQKDRRHQVEEKLKTTESENALILSSMSEVVMHIDRDKRILWANRAAGELFQTSLEEIKGRRCYEVRDGRDSPCGECPVSKAIESGSPQENEISTPQGRHWLVKGYPVFDGSNKPTSCIEYIQDITEHKMAEKTLMEINEILEVRVEERTEELTQYAQSLEQFTFGASHDLQEPLRKIMTFSDQIEEKYSPVLDDRGLDYIWRLKRACQTMQVMVDDLRVFSRVLCDAGPMISLDINDILENVLLKFEKEITETRACVTIDRIPPIEADPGQMFQLFSCLLDNSFKFSRKGIPPEILISSRLSGDFHDPDNGDTRRENMCRISIKDNGIGFDNKYSSRIFGVFQRLHSKEKYEGTGIGLAICRSIVIHHGGSIAAESEPGKGTTLTVTLPVKHIKEVWG